MNDRASLTGRLARLERLDERLLEEAVVLERLAGPQGHAVERVLGDVAWDAGHLGQQLVDVPQQRAAAGHDHALVDDVRGQLRRGLLQDAPDRGDELLERHLDGLHDLRRSEERRVGKEGRSRWSPYHYKKRWHTRCSRDWSSGVCSSNLPAGSAPGRAGPRRRAAGAAPRWPP